MLSNLATGVATVVSQEDNFPVGIRQLSNCPFENIIL